MTTPMETTTTTSRNHRIHCQFGANEYFAYYKKHGGELDRHLFGCILKDLNLAIADQILSGYAFKMPARMGALVLTKRKEIVTIKDGKVVITQENTTKLDVTDIVNREIANTVTKKDTEIKHLKREKKQSTFLGVVGGILIGAIAF